MERPENGLDAHGVELPVGAFSRLGQAGWRQADAVSLAISGDGARLVTGTEYGTVRFWDAQRGVALGDRVVGNGERMVQAMRFLPDGQRFVTAGPDGVVRLWHFERREVIQSIPIVDADNAPQALDISADGALLATGGPDKVVRVWDVATGELLGSFEGHRDDIGAVRFSPQGDLLASSSPDMSIRLWDVARKRLRRQISTRQLPSMLAWSPDGDLIASVMGRSDVVAFHALTGRKRHRWEQSIDDPLGAILALEFSPDGRSVMTGGSALPLSRWDVDSGQHQMVAQSDPKPFMDLAFVPQVEQFVTVDHQGVAFWDATSASRLRLGEPRGHTGAISDLAFFPNGAGLASLGRGGRLVTWSLPSGDITRVVPDGPQKAHMSISPDGVWLAAVGAKDQGPDGQVWELETGQASPMEPLGHPSGVWFGHKGSIYSAAGTKARAVRRLSALDQVLDGAWSLPCGAGCVFDVDPQERTVALTDHTGLALFELETGQAMASGPQWPRLSFVRFSPDGQKLLAGGPGRLLHLLDASTLETLHVWDAQLGEVLDGRFSPDGQAALSVHADGYVLAWDVEGHQRLGTLDMRASGPTCLDVSPDGALLAVGSSDTTTLLWPTAILGLTSATSQEEQAPDGSGLQ